MKHDENGKQVDVTKGNHMGHEGIPQESVAQPWRMIRGCVPSSTAEMVAERGGKTSESVGSFGTW